MKRIFALVLTFMMVFTVFAAAETQLATGKFWKFGAHSGLVWVLRRDVSMVQVYTEAGDIISEFDPGFELRHAQVYPEYDYAYIVSDDGAAQTIYKIDIDGNVVGEWDAAPEMHVRQVEPMDDRLLLIIDTQIKARYGDMDGLDNYGFFELYAMSLTDGSMEKVAGMPEISWVQYNGQYIVGVDGVQGNMYIMNAESGDVETEMEIPGLYFVELFGDNTAVYMINDINNVEEMPAIYGVMDIDSGDMTELLRIPEAAMHQGVCATENSIFHAYWADEALNVLEIEW